MNAIEVNKILVTTAGTAAGATLTIAAIGIDLDDRSEKDEDPEKTKNSDTVWGVYAGRSISLSWVTPYEVRLLSGKERNRRQSLPSRGEM